MKNFLTKNDRLFIIRSIKAAIDKNLDLISLKEIVDMAGISRYQLVLGEETRVGYETSVLIAPRKGELFYKTVKEAEELLETGHRSELRVIGWYLRDNPEFSGFEELYPTIEKQADFGNEISYPILINKEERTNDPYEGWELTLRDNRYHVNSKRSCKFVK